MKYLVFIFALFTSCSLKKTPQKDQNYIDIPQDNNSSFIRNIEVESINNSIEPIYYSVIILISIILINMFILLINKKGKK